MKNHYKTLGIDPTASTDEVKDAFRALARRYHPDAGAEANDQLFQEISEAYEVLSSDKERKSYDTKFGFSADRHKVNFQKKAREQIKAKERRPSDGLFNGTGTERVPDAEARTTSSKGLFGSTETSASSGLLDRLKGAVNLGSSDAQQEKGGFGAQEIRGARVYQFTIDALESLNGARRELALPGGDEPIMINVNIPAGVSHGDVLEIDTGEGNSSRVKAKIIISPHEFIQRQGLDIILSVPVTIGEALNGAQIEVPCPGGSVKVSLSAQTEGLKKLRIPEKGVREPQGSKVGDLLIQPFIVLPDRISESVKMAASAMDAAYLKNIRGKLPKNL